MSAGLRISNGLSRVRLILTDRCRCQFIALRTLRSETQLRHQPGSVQVRLLWFYYAATALFVLLDYCLDINVRLAALESYPAAKASYYVLCFVCLGLMVWRPSWSTWIAAGESLITLSILIISMALRVMIVTDDMLETGRGVVTMYELVNFMMATGAAYIAWIRSAKVLSGGS